MVVVAMSLKNFPDFRWTEKIATENQMEIISFWYSIVSIKKQVLIVKETHGSGRGFIPER